MVPWITCFVGVSDKPSDHGSPVLLDPFQQERFNSSGGRLCSQPSSIKGPSLLMQPVFPEPCQRAFLDQNVRLPTIQQCPIHLTRLLKKTMPRTPREEEPLDVNV